jgi:hypothetical protein
VHKRAYLTVFSAAAATAALLATATAAGAAEDEPTYANLYASIDLPDFSSGPMEFEALDVLVGDGPELTGDDLIANPSEWCGDIEVDIDLDAMTITVTGGDDFCNFQEAYVAVQLYGGTVLDNVEVDVVEDTLFEGYSLLEWYGVEGGVFDAYWSTCGFVIEEEPQPSPSPSPSGTVTPFSEQEAWCEGEAPSFNMNGLTSFVFSLVEEEPTTDVDDEVEEAPVAEPVVAEPTFTG